MWIVTQQEWILEVRPVDDIKKHLMADECWCVPNEEITKHDVMCSDYLIRTQIIFTHNAADNRKLEDSERYDLVKDMLGKYSGGKQAK